MKNTGSFQDPRIVKKPRLDMGSNFSKPHPPGFSAPLGKIGQSQDGFKIPSAPIEVPEKKEVIIFMLIIDYRKNPKQSFWMSREEWLMIREM
jgi:hypothetical protein